LGEWDAEIPDVAFLLTAAATVVVWGGDRFGFPPTRGWLAWVKPDAPPTFSSLELAWTNQDRPARHLVHSISATNGERVGHPTQKPVRVMQWCMAQARVPEGGMVLDPFAGSGPTGIACIRTGRKFIGIEKDPAYYAIARRRIERELAQGLLDFTEGGE
jgi:site-specific DNA-methyltransferase (adenine-specific)/modification methylase